MDRMLKNLAFLAVLGWLSFPGKIYAQFKDQMVFDTINKDSMGEVTDRFQDDFFQAITQRAIDNPEKAIDILAQLTPAKKENKLAVYFELAENYKTLNREAEAEKYFLKALQIKPDNQSLLTELYGVYQEAGNTSKAISTAKKLTAFDESYYEDLAHLYFSTQAYLPALQALDRLAKKEGRSPARLSLRHRIYRQDRKEKEITAYLDEKIKTKPGNIHNYTDLIYLFNYHGQFKKAFATATKLEHLHPGAPGINLGRYKSYIIQGKNDKAVAAMKAILQNNKLNNDVNVRVIKDFSALVKEHPEYENDLVWALGEAASEGHQSNQDLGEYYIGKDNAKALSYLKKALRETPNKYKLIRETLVLEITEKHYKEALALAKRAQDIFPSQPFLWLMRGRAENGLAQYQSARKSLQTGIDFVIDNRPLQNTFYKALSKTYSGLGQPQKAAAMQQKIKNKEK